MKRLLFLTAILVVSVYFVTAIQPKFVNRSKADLQTEIITVSPFLNPCHFTYLNCDRQAHALTNTTLNESETSALTAIGLAFDLNPRILYMLSATSPLDQNQITSFAQSLHDLVTSSSNPPLVYDHPQLGYFKLQGLNSAEYAYFQLLTQNPSLPYKELLKSPNPNDGQLLGFIETYYSIFQSDPRDP